MLNATSSRLAPAFGSLSKNKTSRLTGAIALAVAAVAVGRTGWPLDPDKARNVPEFKVESDFDPRGTWN